MAGSVSTHSIAITIATIISGLLIISPAWSDGELAPRTFKSMDEAIGWVKARGACSLSLDKTTKPCLVDIELPKSASSGKPISPGYEIVGRMSVIELPDSRHFLISINRSRRIALSPHDPEITIASTHSSLLEFIARGDIAILSAETALRNFKGELLMRAKADPFGELFTTENPELWKEAFGIGWIWKLTTSNN
jgi:hypothetical protein